MCTVLIQTLCVSLKQKVLDFIEDETWMLCKKRARFVFYIKDLIPKIRYRLYCILRNEHMYSNTRMKQFLRLTRVFQKCLKRSHRLRLSRTFIHAPICACICNQTRLMCTYAHSEHERIVTEHQKVYTLLTRLYPSTHITQMYV